MVPKTLEVLYSSVATFSFYFVIAFLIEIFHFFFKLKVIINVTLESLKHLEPAVDQAFSAFPQPALHVPLVHEHC